MESAKFSTPVDLKEIKITDEFWHREQELVRTQVIPYQWEALNDRVPEAAPSFCMRNFQVAGKLMRMKKEKGSDFVAPSYTFRGFETLPDDPNHLEEDKFYGFVFQDTDFSKWIEAVGYSLTQHPDAMLEATADEAIDIVCAAQLENGYLDTYYIINGMDKAFTNLRDHHELYCLGHLIEGAVAYYEATGKDKLLRAACRFADYVADYFGPQEQQCKGYPGHEIAEMALVRLYQVTGEEKYLKLSRFFLEQRGKEPYYFDREDETRASYEGRPFKPNTDPLRYAYNQAHKPILEQDEAVGHSVRAVYLYSGMADVARLTGNDELFAACKRLWDSMVQEKLYITGGIGATHMGEAFSFPYDLPNDTAYSETCAAIGLAFFARRMLEIQADSQYADVMEQALYNTVLSGMALDGKSFFYVNPLEVVPEACHKDARKFHVKPIRQKWFGCACCPPNIARIVSSIPSYAYTENETTLWTHLYMGSVLTKKVGEQELHLKMETTMPWAGDVKITIGAEAPVHATLAYRIPGWCGTAQMKLSYKTKNPQITQKEEKGYIYLTGDWEEGDWINLTFAMPIHIVAANTKVREDMGRVALTRGPITYCMEEADNGKNLHLYRLNMEDIQVDRTGIATETTQNFGHPVMVLKVPAYKQLEQDTKTLYTEYAPAQEEKTTLTFVPYYLWNNRGEGEMSVWVRV